MYTRQDYLTGKCSHSDYHGQAVTERIIKIVVSIIGKDNILRSTDEHFNDIPLRSWEAFHGVLRNNCLQDNSIAASVCIAKEAARRFKRNPKDYL